MTTEILIGFILVILSLLSIFISGTFMILNRPAWYHRRSPTTQLLILFVPFLSILTIASHLIASNLI